MSYEFIKLSEVEVIETPHNANLLIEENGEIKRLSTDNINFGGSGQQVQADWNETDDTSPAYIANKPSVNGEIVYFTNNCGTLQTSDGITVTVAQMREMYQNGVRMRMDAEMFANGEYGGLDITSIAFGTFCGLTGVHFAYTSPYNGTTYTYHNPE